MSAATFTFGPEMRAASALFEVVAQLRALDSHVDTIEGGLAGGPDQLHELHSLVRVITRHVDAIATQLFDLPLPGQGTQGEPQ